MQNIINKQVLWMRRSLNKINEKTDAGNMFISWINKDEDARTIFEDCLDFTTKNVKDECNLIVDPDECFIFLNKLTQEDVELSTSRDSIDIRISPFVLYSSTILEDKWKPFTKIMVNMFNNNGYNIHAPMLGSKRVNKKLVEIFTDGSANKNFKDNGYAVVFIKDDSNTEVILGRPPAYRHPKTKKIRNTSNRAELYAIRIALKNQYDKLANKTEKYCKKRNLNIDENKKDIMKKYGKKIRVRIVSDSEYAINMLTKYMPNWDDKKFKEKENADITKKSYKMYKLLKKYTSIKIDHIKAHTKNEDRDSKYNNVADKLAKQAREDNEIKYGSRVICDVDITTYL